MWFRFRLVLIAVALLSPTLWADFESIDEIPLVMDVEGDFTNEDTLENSCAEGEQEFYSYFSKDGDAFSYRLLMKDYSAEPIKLKGTFTYETDLGYEEMSIYYGDGYWNEGDDGAPSYDELLDNYCSSLPDIDEEDFGSCWATWESDNGNKLTLKGDGPVWGGETTYTLYVEINRADGCVLKFQDRIVTYVES